MLALPSTKEVKKDPADQEFKAEEPPPETVPKPAEQVAAPRSQFYAQVEAFIYEENAWNEKNALQIKVDRTVLVAVVRNDPVPYKVIIGPFNSRNAATNYLSQHRLRGFPRTASGLLFPSQ